MTPLIDNSADVAERRLQRLEHRYRRAQIALASARALHSALQAAIERAEDQTAAA